jgi:hypothetical protein
LCQDEPIRPNQKMGGTLSVGTEAFVWIYREREPASLPFSEVISAFGNAVSDWEPEFGRAR